MADIDYSTADISDNSLSPFDGLTIPKDFIFTYEVCLRGGYLTHTWALRHEVGAVHIWARISKCPGYADEWIGGIECHWPKPPEGYGSWFTEKPSQEHCWLLQGPCWHDGSSLYFSEQIAPMLPHPFDPAPHSIADRHHRCMAHQLLSWHRDKIAVTLSPDNGREE